jgi:hypothetical protein
MSLSDEAKATSQSKPKIWREIRARLSSAPSEPQWSGHRRSERRLRRLLIAELLLDQRTTPQDR